MCICAETLDDFPKLVPRLTNSISILLVRTGVDILIN
jgi:hypothetical protein